MSDTRKFAEKSSHFGSLKILYQCCVVHSKPEKPKTTVIMLLLKVTVVSCVCLVAITAEPNSACTTPDNKEGECILFERCSVLYSLLRNLTNEKTSHLRRSRCGTDGGSTTVKVCCPRTAPAFLQSNSTSSTSGISSSLLPKTCGLLSAEDRVKIIWGENADIGSHSWAVLLKYRKNNELRFLCGGTLISERYVLTAAHCVSENYLLKNATLVSVRLGEHNLDTDPDCEILAQNIRDCNNPFVEIPVEEIIVHEEFSKHNSKVMVVNDIALLRLKTKVTFNDFIFPACLPVTVKELEEKYSGVRLLRAGWDINNFDGATSQIIRNMVFGKSPEECKEMFNLTLTENQFCAVKSPDYRKCSSDSGGAVTAISIRNHDVGHYVAGVEVGHRPCTVDQIAVYTRVGAYTKWIVENLRE